jgi:hypothetical protein
MSAAEARVDNRTLRGACASTLKGHARVHSSSRRSRNVYYRSLSSLIGRSRMRLPVRLWLALATAAPVQSRCGNLRRPAVGVCRAVAMAGDPQTFTLAVTLILGLREKSAACRYPDRDETTDQFPGPLTARTRKPPAIARSFWKCSS